ncbi:glycine zipper 2TM domain-containing protein [Silanimonas sp.]|jgi:outer membrane lipoprotein SlyB|uniref:glycine zipper 2TM domain-containing protein n=1 Tax=Silanimonas sp. TaxID=1929290 RepID=UPI0022CB31F3|nr:glycine zipper 2TM domain-containing protein [Silanimonas sp.]MCZ8113433.1 glycine zipper 2TM domain-containing protein [Silanimonas sp.]
MTTPRSIPRPALALGLIATAVLSACSTQPTTRRYAQYEPAPYQEPQRCYDCGTVETIVRVYGARENTRTGAVIGGVLGAIVGRELADDSSRGRRNTATVAGAAAGALAGNAIENRANEESFDVTVRMDDGRRLTVNVTALPNGVRNGAYVRYDGRRLQALR